MYSKKKTATSGKSYNELKYVYATTINAHTGFISELILQSHCTYMSYKKYKEYWWFTLLILAAFKEAIEPRVLGAEVEVIPSLVWYTLSRIGWPLWYIRFTDNNGYARNVVRTTRTFSDCDLLNSTNYRVGNNMRNTTGATFKARYDSHSEHIRSPSVFGGVCFAYYLDCLSIGIFFSHGIVCLSSTYMFQCPCGNSLPLFYNIVLELRVSSDKVK